MRSLPPGDRIREPKPPGLIELQLPLLHAGPMAQAETVPPTGTPGARATPPRGPAAAGCGVVHRLRSSGGGARGARKFSRDPT